MQEQTIEFYKQQGNKCGLCGVLEQCSASVLSVCPKYNVEEDLCISDRGCEYQVNSDLIIDVKR